MALSGLFVLVNMTRLYFYVFRQYKEEMKWKDEKNKFK